MSTRVYCEGFVYQQRKYGWTSCSSERFYILKNFIVSVYNCKRDATLSKSPIETFEIKAGQLVDAQENAIELNTIEASSRVVRVPSRVELVKWITAFHRLEEIQRQDQERSSPKVKFYDTVRIRTVPSLSSHEISILFYSQQDMIRFTIDAYSLRSRIRSFIYRI